MAKKKTKTKKSKVKVARSTSPYASMSVNQLLDALGKTEDPIEKRKIRSQLRKAGHTGGLNKSTKKDKKVAKKTVTKKSKKKTSKKS